jgi:hypothetical protein
MTTVLRGLTVTICAGLALVATAGPAAAGANAIVTQPFAADSGDICGETSGKLAWHVGPIIGQNSIVEVSGTLADRPVPTDPSLRCNDDRISYAKFTAFSGKTMVDGDADKADNERVSFSFELSAPLGTPIDRVVIQVCRLSTAGTGDYCGKPVEYKTPA